MGHIFLNPMDPNVYLWMIGFAIAFWALPARVQRFAVYGAWLRGAALALVVGLTINLSLAAVANNWLGAKDKIESMQTSRR